MNYISTLHHSKGKIMMVTIMNNNERVEHFLDLYTINILNVDIDKNWNFDIIFKEKWIVSHCQFKLGIYEYIIINCYNNHINGIYYEQHILRRHTIFWMIANLIMTSKLSVPNYDW